MFCCGFDLTTVGLSGCYVTIIEFCKSAFSLLPVEKSWGGRENRGGGGEREGRPGGRGAGGKVEVG